MDITKQNRRRIIDSTIHKLITGTLFLIALLAAVLFLTILVSCSKDVTIPPQSTASPTLSSISLENGSETTAVTINGNHFGNNIDSVQVFFNDIEATVQTVSDNEIRTVLHRKANTGVVKVVVNGKAATGPPLPYDNTGIQVSTLAGSTSGFANGAGTFAKFNNPFGVAVDGQGNVYVADSGNHKIRKITPNGVVSTLAGSGAQGFADNIVGISAKFYHPFAVAVDVQGNVYVADAGNHKIRKIAPNGSVTTLAGSTKGFADGMSGSAQFSFPSGVAVDVQGNVYVGDQWNHKIRKISPNGVVSTLAGSIKGFKNGTSAKFNQPVGVAVDVLGNVYVADQSNHRIRIVTPTGVVSTPVLHPAYGVSDNLRSTVKLKLFHYPQGIAIDASGSIYVVGLNNKAQKITLNGAVHTLAGSTYGFADGPGASAKFWNPRGIAVDALGNLYVADRDNDKIRKIKQ